MSSVIIDRRKNDKGRSSTNRRKFINRVRDLVKESVKDLVRDGKIGDLVGSEKKKIKIPVRNLDEPHFRHDGSGINDRVLPGNDSYVVGDQFDRPQSGEGGGGGEASAEGEGEDTFTFHLSKDEFLDLFFENCALPDMIKDTLALVNEEVTQRSGFVSNGSPSMLNIVRSMIGAKSRRTGLKSFKGKKLKGLLEQEQMLLDSIATYESNGNDSAELQEELKSVRKQIQTIKDRLGSIPFLDPIDLRYNNWTKVQVPSVQAVVFCTMDVSGSMDERKKELAKTFFILLYLFLTKNYEHIVMEFVRYHTNASVVTEDEFYNNRETGGTVTSTGLQKVCEVIKEKYPTDLWNIYVAHASDGDNWQGDNAVVEKLLVEQLLPIVQYYAYVQITPEHSFYASSESTLLTLFERIAKTHPNLDCAQVLNEEDVYPVFIKLFER